MTLNSEITRLAALIKTGFEACDSIWQNCEAETIALQVICGSANNLKNMGDAFTWDKVKRGSQNGGIVNNSIGIDILFSGGYLRVGTKDGKPVFRPTMKMVREIDRLIKRKVTT